MRANINNMSFLSMKIALGICNITFVRSAFSFFFISILIRRKALLTIFVNILEKYGLNIKKTFLFVWWNEIFAVIL